MVKKKENKKKKKVKTKHFSHTTNFLGTLVLKKLFSVSWKGKDVPASFGQSVWISLVSRDLWGVYFSNISKRQHIGASSQTQSFVVTNLHVIFRPKRHISRYVPYTSIACFELAFDRPCQDRPDWFVSFFPLKPPPFIVDATIPALRSHRLHLCIINRAIFTKKSK